MLSGFSGRAGSAAVLRCELVIVPPVAGCFVTLVLPHPRVCVSVRASLRNCGPSCVDTTARLSPKHPAEDIRSCDHPLPRDAQRHPGKQIRFCIETNILLAFLAAEPRLTCIICAAHATGEPGVFPCGQDARHKRHQEAGLLGDGCHVVVTDILLGLPASTFSFFSQLLVSNAVRQEYSESTDGRFRLFIPKLSED